MPFREKSLSDSFYTITYADKGPTMSTESIILNETIKLQNSFTFVSKIKQNQVYLGNTLKWLTKKKERSGHIYLELLKIQHKTEI